MFRLNRRAVLPILALILVLGSFATVGSTAFAWNGCQCDPTVNLVKNGSFETPVVTDSHGWNIYNSIPGWSVIWTQKDPTTYVYNGVTYNRPTHAKIELQRPGVGDIPAGWAAADGKQYTELSSDWFGPNSTLPHTPASVSIYQEVSTVPGQSYTLGFSFSARPGWADNVMVVSWNGNDIATVSADGTGHTTTSWLFYTYNVVATHSLTRINFTDAGIPDSYGTFLDNVSLYCTASTGTFG